VATAAAACRNSVDIQKIPKKTPKKNFKGMIGGQTVTVTVVGGGKVA
jgi:hypothetical protein